MTIKPLRNEIVLEEIVQEASVGGIIIADSASNAMEFPPLANILELGPDANSALVVGQKVLIRRHLFDDVELEKTKYLIGKDDGVTAILE